MTTNHGFTKTKAIKEERRKQAELNNAEYNKLTTQQKIDRLPIGGAKKQRAKLEAKLVQEKRAVVKEESAKVEEEMVSKKGKK